MTGDFFQDLARRTDWVVLDTETTGLDTRAEIIEIAVVSHAGEVLLDTLVRPRGPLPERITRLTGITPEMVERAPAWPGVATKLRRAVRGKTVVAYGADFDCRLVVQSSRAWGFELSATTRWDRWACAMEAYRGASGHPKWVSLDAAARETGLWMPPGGLRHRAWFDAWLTLRLIHEAARA